MVTLKHGVRNFSPGGTNARVGANQDSGVKNDSQIGL
jgi:hypothetical protein